MRLAGLQHSITRRTGRQACTHLAQGADADGAVDRPDQHDAVLLRIVGMCRQCAARVAGAAGVAAVDLHDQLAGVVGTHLLELAAVVVLPQTKPLSTLTCSQMGQDAPDG